MKPSRIFLAALGILLVGYAFLGRGFAYIGFPPLYVGEIVLALGLLCFLLGGGMGLALRSPISWLLLLYMSWGALRTYPYISVYGVNALRDAVIWSYGLFAFLVAAYVLRAGYLSRIPLWYGRVLPWFLVWIPIAFWVQASLDERVLKSLLVNGAPLLNVKAGDASVHFAGAMAFLMLGLHRALVAPTQAYKAPKEWIYWMLWFSVAVFLISWSRGGFLSIAGALFLLVVFHPTRFRAGSAGQFLLISIFAAVLLVIGFLTSLEFDTGGDRKVSVPQIMSNIASIFGDQPSASGSVQETKNWRLKWWTEIANYTVFGEYFWTGKGFGINLAEADGFRTVDKLRSPHSALFTTLAREGVPGLALWILLQVSFGSALMRAYFRARRLGQALCAKICFWVLTYWFAFLINASFDVFLEGPHGGIWFWSLFGFGIAVLETQRRLHLHEMASRSFVSVHQRIAGPPAAV